MAENSAIEWTTHTFNPWWGCVRVSPGCQHCYAETLAHRYGHDIWGVDKPRRFFGDKHWNLPVKWNRDAEGKTERTYVFSASMSDWLEDQPYLVEPRARLMKLVEDTPNLTWLLLTKRIENAPTLALNWRGGAPQNAWFGVTTEDQKRYNERIDILIKLKDLFNASKIWLSIEPQLGPIFLNGRSVDWIICGGESGYGSRPFESLWGRILLRQCQALGIPFFMKQLGGYPDKRDKIDGFPEDLRVRQFPA